MYYRFDRMPMNHDVVLEKWKLPEGDDENREIRGGTETGVNVWWRI